MTEPMTDLAKLSAAEIEACAKLEAREPGALQEFMDASGAFRKALVNAYRTGQLVERDGVAGVDVIAAALWNAGFHEFDISSGLAEAKKSQWPEDWKNCQRKAAAVHAALKGGDHAA